MTTNQADIDRALQIEREVPEANRELYLDCMDNLPMSQRKTDQELHDGCLLTQYVYQYIINYRAHKGPPI